MSGLLERNNLVLDDQMVVGIKNSRTAVGVTDAKGRKYYIEYPSDRAATKEQARSLLMEELGKRFK